jgi:Mrp family chromosome partitioning ATPase
MEAVSANLAAATIGLLDFDEVGPAMTKLADETLRQAEVAAQEIELRGTV